MRIRKESKRYGPSFEKYHQHQDVIDEDGRENRDTYTGSDCLSSSSYDMGLSGMPSTSTKVMQSGLRLGLIKDGYFGGGTKSEERLVNSVVI